jgi:arylsulfatase
MSLRGSPRTCDIGKIYSVTVGVSGELIEDQEAEARMHMARQ